jgi:hypothetical protein
LIDLDKVDKEELSGYLTLAQAVVSLVPGYGAAGFAVLEAGKAINDAQAASQNLLDYQRGFQTGGDRGLRYSPYALIAQKAVSGKNVSLGFDPTNGVLSKNGTPITNVNWAVLEVIKGSHQSFVVKRSNDVFSA